MSPVMKRKKSSFGITSQDFGKLEHVHPYGVLPGGNRFFSDDRNPNDGLLGEEEWLSILGFLSGPDLARFVLSCRYFYVIGHQPELWRDLTLRKMQKIDNGTFDRAESSWKDTYAKAFHGQTYVKAHQPISMPGMFSDTLYRLHSCRSFHLPPAWGDHTNGNLPRVPYHDMTMERFRSEYESLNKPVIVEGAAKEWTCSKKWSDPNYLLDATRGRSFRATSGVAPLPANFSLESYYDYCKFYELEEAPLYLFDRTALEPGSQLWDDYMIDLRRTCPYWDPQRDDNGHDLFKILGEGKRPDHTWLIVGPQRSGSVFHIDPNATNAWNAAICGRKRWIFYPPGVTPPGVYPSSDGDHVALPLSVGEWLFQFWDDHCDRMANAPPGERPMEATTLPGDVIFVPHGWWHMVINLDAPMNIAITHNYVSSSDNHLPNVLRFLREKRDQVSGCRDREESIKPEHLYEKFVDALSKYDATMLTNALSVSDWTCRAWNRAKRENPDEHATESSVCKKRSLMEVVKEETSFSFSFM